MNHPRTSLRIILALMLVVGVSGRTLAEDDKPKPEKKKADQQLLEDLQNDLLEGIELDLPPKKDEKKNKHDKPNQPQDEPVDGTGDSAAVGGGDEDPLTTIARKMLDAGQRLAREDSSDQTQALQKQIAADLKKLIANAKKRQGSSSASGGSKTKTTAPKKIGKKPGGKNDASARAGATVESTERLGKADAKKADAEQIRQRVEASWGVLPEQVREQMRHAAGDDFLGEFELMIENYFKRLAEHEPIRP
jgi:hypothetical protein